MEPLTLKPRLPAEDHVENWDDDDDFLIDNDDLTFRSSSSMSNTHRRDSLSSMRSGRESLPGREERHVHLPGDDEKSTLDAIAAAAHAGIPIPANVPSSALMGGTIKRLGGRKVKKIFQEDWGDDLDLPDAGQSLQIKKQDPTKFPEVIRQVSGSSLMSPLKNALSPSPMERSPIAFKTTPSASPLNLDRFKDIDEDDDVFGDGAATIKAPKLRVQTKPIPLITPPTPQREPADDEFEMDFELPSDGKLQLSKRKDIPKTPAMNASDDFDWGEGSLGTRFGGTGRGPFSARSSSVSALSPSIASSITAESEDEHLDGLELPMGPLDLGERLQRRKMSRSPDRQEPDFGPRSSIFKEASTAPASDKEDFLAGLEIGDGDVFSGIKSTLHKNVKVKETKIVSPLRPKTAVSITFSNKPSPTSQSSRLPRPSSGHERSHAQPTLEPVSESGGPITTRPSRRSQSRLSGHSAHSSISSIHTPTTPTVSSGFQQSTPSRRRELGQKASTGALRQEPTTTSAQLLRLKRSLPVLRAGQSPPKPSTVPASSSASRIDRPVSRGNDSRRPHSYYRPRTPIENSAAISRKPPFSTGGASQSHSNSLNHKTSRPFRRHDSDHGPEIRPASRTASRSMIRSPSPRNFRRHEKHGSDSSWQQLSRPRRARAFGDGHELDAFDDLPTSAQTESKFTKTAVGSGNVTRGSIRNKIYQNVLPERHTPSPVSPYSPMRNDYTPRFARDTAASRNAREANLAQRAPAVGPLAPLTTARVSQLTTTRSINQNLPLQNHTPSQSLRLKKSRKPAQLKPHLISNLTGAKETKVINGMTYNPATYRWEGNENALNKFDPPTSSPSTASLPPHMVKEKEVLTPGPVLIKDMGSSRMRKQVGDMVFDPHQMCWIKVQADQQTPTPRSSDILDGFQVIEEDDPFKDIPDLDDKESTSGNVTRGRVSDVNDEWMVGEEFDVGPEFIRRQREEEERWRKKCEKWVSGAPRNQDTWRWSIRDMIMSG